MNDPIEELIQSVPLRTPSSECDQKVISGILAQATKNNGNPVAPIDHKSGIPLLALATAASLMIGFFLGTALQNNNRIPEERGASHSEGAQKSISFDLVDNVQLVEGKSKTVIVGESVHFQDDLPVRKVETVTHKKILVRDEKANTQKELEVPIRKVFFTLAETI